MNYLLLFLVSLLTMCSNATPIVPISPEKEKIDIQGKWQITDEDKPNNFYIEIMDFQNQADLVINFDLDHDRKIDQTRELGYYVKDYLGKESLFIIWGQNDYLWAYPTIKNDTLLLDMIRVDSPRIAHYIKIEE